MCLPDQPGTAGLGEVPGAVEGRLPKAERSLIEARGRSRRDEGSPPGSREGHRGHAGRALQLLGGDGGILAHRVEGGVGDIPVAVAQPSIVESLHRISASGQRTGQQDVPPVVPFEIGVDCRADHDPGRGLTTRPVEAPEHLVGERTEEPDILPHSN